MSARSRPWVAVVGAGPAGIMASRAAVEGGARVTLVDEAPRPGGQIYRQAPASLGEAGLTEPGERARKARVLEVFEAVAGEIDYRPATTAHSLFAGPRLHIATDAGSEELMPDAVILATGVSETAIPFPGWTLPGVLYAGGAQAVMKASLVRPGDAAVVAGLGPLPMVVASQLLAAGCKVRAVALFHSFKRLALDPLGLWAGRNLVREGLAERRRLRRAGVEILEAWQPLCAEGQEGLERVLLAPHFGTGAPDATGARCFEVDLLAVNHGFSANSELARMAGVPCRFFGPRGGWAPLADGHGRTSIQGVYVAGDCAGLGGALVAEAEGSIVGAAAAADLRGVEPPDLSGLEGRRKRHLRFQRALTLLFDLPPGTWDSIDDATLVCRCEGVTKGRLCQALDNGHRTLDAIKRNTRAGLGYCGGRTCLPTMAALLSNGRLDPNLPPMRARPVAHPATLRALADCKARADEH